MGDLHSISKFNKSKLERLLFFIICLLGLIPLFQGKYFPTLDGAAHIHSSIILKELMFGNNVLFENFYQINKVIVPNWISHAILAFLGLVFPPYLCEKVLLIAFLIALPYAFRLLVFRISGGNIGLSYFIFPFSYSFPFILGFYNFSIAIIFLLVGLNFWLKHKNHPINPFTIFTMLCIVLLTYLSHVLVFVFLLFFITINFALDIVNANEAKIGEMYRKNSNKIWLLVLSAIPSIILFGIYYTNASTSKGAYQFLSKSELWEWLKIIRPIIAYNTNLEKIYTEKIFYVFAGITSFILLQKIIGIYKSFEQQSDTKKWLNTSTDLLRINYWAILAIALLLLYFILPDGNAYAGYISNRLGLLFFIFMILWFASNYLPKFITWIATGMVLVFHFQLLMFYNPVIQDLNKMAVDCEKAAEAIPANSIVLPFNYSSNWLTNHFANYLGVNKPIVVLKNYELDAGYFPVQWNESKIPNTYLVTNNLQYKGCKFWKYNSKNEKMPIDYLFVIGSLPSNDTLCSNISTQLLLENYTLSYQNDNCSVYELKKQ